MTDNVKEDKFNQKLVDILLDQIDMLEQDGKSPDEIKRLITEVNQAQDNPLSLDDLKITIYPFIKGLDDIDDDFIPANKIEVKEVEWLFKDRIPKGEITIIGGEGGSGKTSLWIALAVAVASGKASIFDKNTDDEIPLNDPGKVLFLTTEDSLSYGIGKKIEGYNMKPEYQTNLLGMDASNPHISEYTFGSDRLRRAIDKLKPALVVFDPIQGFIPDNVEMSKRNQMRHVMAPLKALGAKYGTAFIVIQHTNKREKATSVRNVLSDSSDTYDIARAVLMVGKTGKKDRDGNEIRALSTDKESYAPEDQIPTILFTLKDGKVTFYGTTDKKYIEIQRERSREYYADKPQPVRDETKDDIIDYLENNGGKAITGELDDYLINELGHSQATVRRAKDDLKNEGMIKRFRKNNKHYTELAN